MSVQSRNEKETVTAEIKCLLTREAQSPVRLVLTTFDNLLLYFESCVTPEMVLEMVAKLKMVP